MADSALNGSCKFLMTSNIRQIEKEIQVNYRLDDNDHTSVSITPPLMTNWTGGGTDGEPVYLLGPVIAV